MKVELDSSEVPGCAYVQQHRAGASDSLTASPQKRENQGIVHFAFGGVWSAGGTVAGSEQCMR